jgi:y4mF family transcriptional regulator
MFPKGNIVSNESANHRPLSALGSKAHAGAARLENPQNAGSSVADAMSKAGGGPPELLSQRLTELAAPLQALFHQQNSALGLPADGLPASGVAAAAMKRFADSQSVQADALRRMIGDSLARNTFVQAMPQLVASLLPSPPRALVRPYAPFRDEQSDRVRTAADLGAMIRKARKAMKMTQAEFATHAGVGRRFVSELEGGKASLEFDRVMACAEAAGIDLLARQRGG